MHIVGKKNTGADGLSRMYCDEKDVPDHPEEDIKDWIDTHIGRIAWDPQGYAQYGGTPLRNDFPRLRSNKHLPGKIPEDRAAATIPRMATNTLRNAIEQLEPEAESDDEEIPEAGPDNLEEANANDTDRIEPKELLGYYSREHREIAHYLQTIETPPNMSKSERRNLTRRATRYIVIKGHLFYRGQNRRPHRRILDKQEDQTKALKFLHDLHSYRGIEGTMNLVRLRYHWEGLPYDVKTWVELCLEYQKMARSHIIEPLYVSVISRAFAAKWHINATSPGKDNSGKKWLI